MRLRLRCESGSYAFSGHFSLTFIINAFTVTYSHEEFYENRVARTRFSDVPSF